MGKAIFINVCNKNQFRCLVSDDRNNIIRKFKLKKRDLIERVSKYDIQNIYVHLEDVESFNKIFMGEIKVKGVNYTNLELLSSLYYYNNGLNDETIIYVYLSETGIKMMIMNQGEIYRGANNNIGKNISQVVKDKFDIFNSEKLVKMVKSYKALYNSILTVDSNYQDIIEANLKKDYVGLTLFEQYLKYLKSLFTSIKVFVDPHRIVVGTNNFKYKDKFMKEIRELNQYFDNIIYTDCNELKLFGEKND